MPTFISICLIRSCTTTRTPIDGLLRKCTATRLADGDTGNDGQGGISHLLSFVDDISSCVYLPDLHFTGPLPWRLHWLLRKPSQNQTMGPPSYLPSLLRIHPWCAHSSIPSHHSQQHLILPTKLLPTSLLNSPLAFGVLVNPTDPITLPPISSFATSMTSKRI